VELQRLECGDALASLRSGPDGLGEAEAQRRLRQFGPNRVEGIPRESELSRLLRAFVHFFAVVLWIGAGLAFLAERYRPGEGMATLGAAIVAVIAINGVFSWWQERKAERAFEALQRLLPLRVRVLRDGHLREVDAAEITVGDVIALAEGDDVAADARVVEGVLRVNAATITGESLPITRDARACDEHELSRARNVVLAGTSVVGGHGRAVVFATGMATEFGRIARLAQAAEPRDSPLQRELARLSRLVAVLATAAGALFFAAGAALGLSPWASFTFAIGIIVANVPEGLLPTVTLSMALASQRMARHRTLIRHLPSVETLGCASTICADKTGTLTENRMRAARLRTFDGERDARAAARDAAFAARHRALFEAAWLCEDVAEVERAGALEWSGDPTEVALVALARDALPERPRWPRVGEIAFDSDRKRLSTLHQSAAGLVLFTKGALESVLPLCAAVQDGERVEPLDAQARRSWTQAQDDLAGQGLRVLAFAWRPAEPDAEVESLETGLRLLGLVALEDPPRASVPDALRRCAEAGIRVIMLTGDHPATACAVARQIGLVRGDDPRVVSGHDLARLSDAELQLLLDTEVLFARIGADQKLRVVRALQARGQVVAVTGDGVNDAPALRAADIGIAMGIAGTDVAREAADLVLLDDDFASIVAAIEEGRAVYDNIRKFLTYILTSNVPEVVPYLAFALLRVPLALTVIQILAVDLGTDMLPALALGAERPDPETLRRPPRRPQERMLDAPLLWRAYVWLGGIQAAAAMGAFFFALWRGGWSYGDALASGDPLYLRATTACLAAIVVAQVANALVCRSARQPALTAGAGWNPAIVAGIAVELTALVAIAYTPLGNALFGTAPLEPVDWLAAALGGAALFALEEIRKAFVRRRASA
jgi:calcium-translocating P-type ATPase